ncbi:unnamed protein product, partial [Brenthis ino]
MDELNDEILNDSPTPLAIPSSEVGLPGTSEKDTGQNIDNIGDNESDRWKILFDMQQRQILELVRAIKEPNSNHFKIVFPEYNSDLRDSNARAWCNTVDLCMQENPLSGSDLIITMAKALKGSAASCESAIERSRIDLDENA